MRSDHHKIKFKCRRHRFGVSIPRKVIIMQSVPPHTVCQVFYDLGILSAKKRNI